jgi:hypothetical protein
MADTSRSRLAGWLVWLDYFIRSSFIQKVIMVWLTVSFSGLSFADTAQPSRLWLSWLTSCLSLVWLLLASKKENYKDWMTYCPACTVSALVWLSGWLPGSISVWFVWLWQPTFF